MRMHRRDPEIVGWTEARLGVVIRRCRREDLAALEWWGVYRPHRGLIRATFRRQERGTALMLVAEANGTAAGQAWVEFPRRSAAPGFIWAVRVFPCLQGKGIGTGLIAAAERALIGRGVGEAEISIERNNVGARRLYERLGYESAGICRCGAVKRRGGAARGQWVLRKRLKAA